MSVKDYLFFCFFPGGLKLRLDQYVNSFSYLSIYPFVLIAILYLNTVMEELPHAGKSLVTKVYALWT